MVASIRSYNAAKYEPARRSSCSFPRQASSWRPSSLPLFPTRRSSPCPARSSPFSPCPLSSSPVYRPKRLYAETRTAAALTPEAVWEAINAAKDGDTVQLPEGTAVWKKGWNTGHGAKMKAITIQGAGIDKTIIRDTTQGTAGDKPFVINGVEGKPFRITGITFDGTGLPNAGVWAGEIVIGGNCKNFRIDHCKFLNMDRMMTIKGDTYGLIDHCYFHALEKQGRRLQTIMYRGTRQGELPQAAEPGHRRGRLLRGQRGPFQPGGGEPDGQQSLDRAQQRRRGS